MTRAAAHLLRHARVHPVPLAAGVLVALLTAQLGNWQVERALDKDALRARYESAAFRRALPLEAGKAAALPEWQTVSAHGVWRAADAILLDNRVHGGRAGYHVLMPLELATGGWVLVNRGWVAGGAQRAQLPAIDTPAGPVTVSGRVRKVAAAPFVLAPEAGDGPVWQVLDLPRYRARSGLAVADLVVQQSDPAADTLVREWPAPYQGSERHRAYALQWYVFILIAAFGVVYAARQEHRGLNAGSEAVLRQQRRAAARKARRGTTDAEEEDAFLEQ